MSGRLGAYQILDLTHAPEGAYVVDLNYETATQAQQDMLAVIAGTLNNTGPKNLTPAETRRLLVKGVGLGLTNDQLGRRFNAPPAQIRTVKAEIAARGKLDRAGIDPDRLKVTSGTFRVLGQEKAQNLLSKPFCSVANLAASASLKPAELRSVLAEICELDSETAQVQRIGELASEMDERIRQVALTGSIPNPPPARIADRALGNILKYEADPASLKEPDPSRVAQHLDVFRRSISTMEKVIRGHEEEGHD